MNIYSYYIAKAYDKNGEMLYYARSYSFDECLWNFNNWREDKEAVRFEITYPEEK